MIPESHSLCFNMQDFIRVDFIQKLWWSQYQMEKKMKQQAFDWELAMEQVPKVTGDREVITS